VSGVIDFQCGHCGKLLRVPRERVPPGGLSGSCPACGQTISVRGEVTTEPEVAHEAGSSPSTGPASASGPETPADAVLFLKTPAGEIEKITERHLQRELGTQRILPWDLISENGRDFTPIVEHPRFDGWFADLDVQIQHHCWRHAKRLAELVCHQCGRGYCGACKPAPASTLASLRTCPACDDVLKPADLRWNEKPFWKRLNEVVVYPLRDGAWITTAGIGFFLWLGSQGGNAFRIYLFAIALLVYLVGLSYLVHVVWRSAKGEKKMSSGPESIDPMDLAATGLVAFCVMLIVFSPIILLNGYLVYRTFSEQKTPGALWFLNVPLVLVALVYYPMALGMSAVWDNKWLALRPSVVVGHILKIKRDYAILVVAIAVIGAAQFALEMLARNVPFLGGILAHMSTAYLAVIEAHILGWTLYMNSRELGWS
jgi:hypothetical protein